MFKSKVGTAMAALGMTTGLLTSTAIPAVAVEPAAGQCHYAVAATSLNGPLTFVVEAAGVAAGAVATQVECTLMGIGEVSGSYLPGAAAAAAGVLSGTRLPTEICVTVNFIKTNGSSASSSMCTPVTGVTVL